MKEFWIDFSGYVKIMARDDEDAKMIFYDSFDSFVKLNISHLSVEIDCIEEEESCGG